MKQTIKPQVPYPDANDLLDTVKQLLGIESDAALARRISTNPSVISGIRAGRREIGPSIWVSMHEETGLPTKQLKALLKHPGTDGA